MVPRINTLSWKKHVSTVDLKHKVGVLFYILKYGIKYYGVLLYLTLSNIKFCFILDNFS